MKKHIISFVLCVLVLFAFTSSAYAAEITDVKTDFPDISAAVACSDGESIDISKVSATLDGKKLKVKDGAGEQSTEWIVLIDTSKSSNKYFDSEKAAIISICESLGETDSLKLYSFKETTQAILNGSESKEEAVNKIKAIKCDGEYTAFYEAVSLMLDDVKNSKADKCVPLIISDGEDTQNTLKKEDIAAKLGESSVPVYGYYADNLADNTAKEFDSFLKLSGGGAKAISPDTASSVIASAAKSGSNVIHFEASEPVSANENAVFSIDLGDGKSISKKVPVKEWAPKPDETKTPAQSTTEEPTTKTGTQPGDDGSDGGLLKILIPVLVVLVIAALAFVLLKKKKSPDNDKIDKKHDNDSDGGNDDNADEAGEVEEVDEDEEPEVEDTSEEPISEAEDSTEEVVAPAAVTEVPEVTESEDSGDEPPAVVAPVVDKKASQDEERKAKEAKKAEDKKRAEADKAAKDSRKAQQKKDAEREKVRKMRKAEADKKAKETKKAEAKKKAEEEKKAKKDKKSEDKKKKEAAKKAESKKVSVEITAKDTTKAEKQKEADREKLRKMKKAEADKKAKEAKKAEAKKKAEEEKKAKKQKKIDDKKHQESSKKAQQFQFYFEDKGDGRKK